MMDGSPLSSLLLPRIALSCFALFCFVSITTHAFTRKKHNRNAPETRRRDIKWRDLMDQSSSTGATTSNNHPQQQHPFPRPLFQQNKQTNILSHHTHSTIDCPYV
uniref:Transmembrane protein n=1 Tax=Craspedostauros australis TaxID=1486917 RepID=A0A6T6ET08_9STRA|mmetsp:Transcript_14427/g.39740  ORF Transcript_14427/g.39740 Transcript_14427/m.39740 type:complete len:105 (+) Transcript_14427:253-567(+)